MLRITIDETPTEQKWILQGKLSGPWVALLATKWRLTREARQGRRCVVNLNELTFVDQCGEKALRAMKKEGAELLACGVYTRHVLGCYGQGQKATGDTERGKDDEH
jgi:hypothetical protein